MADVLLISDAVYNPSGFGMAAKYLAFKLMDMGFKVVNASFNTLGYLNYVDIEVTSLQRLDKTVKKYQPEFTIFLGPPFITPISQMIDSPEFEQVKKMTKLILYGVHEGLQISPEVDDKFARFHVVATPNRFMHETFEFDKSRVFVLHHYIDTEFWDPRLYSPKRAYKIGFIATNHPRKRFDVVLALTMELVKHYRDAVPTYLKTTPNGAWNISAIAKLLAKLEQSLIGWHVDDTIYNEYEMASHVHQLFYVNTHLTDGEAHAYPIMQSLLLCQPVVATEHPALTEIYGDLVEWVRPSQQQIAGDGILYVRLSLGDADKAFDKVKMILSDYEGYSDRLCSKVPRKDWDYRSQRHEQEINTVLEAAMKYDHTIKDDLLRQIGKPELIE